MQIKGNYDVLLVPYLLPTSYLLQTLPPSVRSIEPSPFAPFTAEQVSALGLDAAAFDASSQQPVIFELGHQTGTGPPPFGLIFQEAKLEILGMRHPDAPQGSITKGENGFVYKQLILFSSYLLTTSSNLIAGLRASRTVFDPKTSPSNYEASYQGQVNYDAKGYVSVSLERKPSPSQADRDHAAEAIRWAGRPWFGATTPKDTLTKFNFDQSTSPFEPIAYEGELKFRPQAFLDPTMAYKPVESLPPQEWLDFEGVKAYRFKADFASQDSKVKDNLTETDVAKRSEL